MATLLNSILIIVALLVVVNGATDGKVSTGISDFLFTDEKADMRNSFYCVAGLMIYPPVYDFYGVNIPIPSLDDIIIAGALTGFILFILSLIKKASPGWKGTILLFAVIWFMFRMLGLLLIYLSGSDCQDTLAGMAGYMSGLYSLGALLGIGALIKVYKASRGV